METIIKNPEQIVDDMFIIVVRKKDNFKRLFFVLEGCNNTINGNPIMYGHFVTSIVKDPDSFTCDLSCSTSLPFDCKGEIEYQFSTDQQKKRVVNYSKNNHAVHREKNEFLRRKWN